MDIGTLDFEDMHGKYHGEELGGFWVTDEEVAALWSRITINAENLRIDMSQNAATRDRLLPQYDTWRANMMTTYTLYSEGSWWDRNFSGTLSTAESFHNELVEWQRRYTATARQPTTGPALEPVVVGGESVFLPEVTEVVGAATKPLLAVGLIIALIIGYKIWNDLK